jgi:pyrimidine operon attenuation protein/uracil phosphoribosyltransferase
MTPSERKILLDDAGVRDALERITDRIVEVAGGTDDLVLIGIQRRGADLAQRIAAMIADRGGSVVPLGVMDITLYRDDLQTVGPRPVIGETHLPPDLDGKWVMIVDDVLYTGRTIRAAMDQLADFGRPARIGLTVLVDRGGRELPIQADITGMTVDARRKDRVDVLVAELDGHDAVELVEREDE